MYRSKNVLLAALALTFSAVSANAVVIVVSPATGVAASSEISTCCGDRDPADIVNGSGLAAGLHNVTPGNMWLSIGTGFGGVDPDPFVVFDLGDVHTISSFHVWNYNEAGAFSTRGVDSVSVEYGTTAARGSTVPGIANFAQAPGANGYAGEDFSSFTPFEARFIKFDINSNHGDADTFYGLSEVQFDGTPSTAHDRITGVTATASSELAGFNRPVGNIVDNVGLDTNNPDGSPGQTAGMWLNQGTSGGNTSIHDLAPEVVFDLGSVEIIGEMHVYNYNENSGNPGLFTRRGVNELEILVSNDNFSSDIRSLGLFNFTQANGLSGLTPDILNLNGVAAQYVKFDIISSHGGDNNFVGLNEVLFFRGSIPEPATATLGLMGLAGLMMRRRRAA